MRDVLVGVGGMSAGMLLMVAIVVGVCLLFRGYYVGMLLFFGHSLGYVLCRRAVLPWLISPYRFYGNLLYRGAVTFVPPSALQELIGTYACLAAYYYGLYSVLARLYVSLNCKNRRIDTSKLAVWVRRGALLSFGLTAIAQALSPLKAFIAVGPIAKMEYADDMITGVLSALIATPLAWFMLLTSYRKSIVASACSSVSG